MDARVPVRVRLATRAELRCLLASSLLSLERLVRRGLRRMFLSRRPFLLLHVLAQRDRVCHVSLALAHPRRPRRHERVPLLRLRLRASARGRIGRRRGGQSRSTLFLKSLIVLAHRNRDREIRF